MRCINKELAAQMEACIKQTHIEVTKQYPAGMVLELSGGAACFSGVDSYLSQVVGWGFATGSKQVEFEIEAIENFYRSHNHSRVDIELCPYVGNDLALFLSRRGYGVSELNNVSACNLTHYSPLECTLDSLILREVQVAEFEQWAKRIALGFAYPEAQQQFLHYIQAKGVKAFAVFEGAMIVAGAVIAMHGHFCDLGVTCTLPTHRNRGIQKKLLAMRLNYAKAQGMSWAIVTTEPGTISDINVQKVGFDCAYTRIKMTLTGL